MLIETTDTTSIKPFLKNLHIPLANSHKGQNGRLLVIGGSKLFHAASLWSAEVASHFVDLVHYSSTQENNAIFINLKAKFTNGIVIERKNIINYVEEDDCILIGPGMVRGTPPRDVDLSFPEILKLKSESDYAFYLTSYLLKNYPTKKFVIDGGALQMMRKEWLKDLKTPAIITPHQKEFAMMFGIELADLTLEEKQKLVLQKAKDSNCVIVLKSIDIIISDGRETITIFGGNAGLTKGGTGDVLSGMIASLNTKNDQVTSATVASYLIKKSADELDEVASLFYNTSDLVKQIPKTLKKLL